MKVEHRFHREGHLGNETEKADDRQTIKGLGHNLKTMGHH